MTDAPPKRPRGRPRKVPAEPIVHLKSEDLEKVKNIVVPSDKAPGVVTISGPEGQDDFEWDESVKPETGAPQSSGISLTASDLAGQLTGAVGGIYAMLATSTGWSGWEMTEAERKAWEAVLLPLVKTLDPSKWGLALALVALLLLTGGKVGGYLMWRKSHAPAPKVVREGAKERPATTPEVAPALGTPMEHAE